MEMNLSTQKRRKPPKTGGAIVAMKKLFLLILALCLLAAGAGADSLKLPARLTEIEPAAFAGCADLTGGIAIPAGVRRIGARAFEDCSGLTGTLTVPGKTEEVGERAFAGCAGFTALRLEAGVKRIGEEAFEGCAGLVTLTVPSGVETFPESALSGCVGLRRIIALTDDEAVLSALRATGAEVVAPPANVRDFTFSVNADGTASVTGYRGDMGDFYDGDLPVPALDPEGRTVTRVGQGAFSYDSGISYEGYHDRRYGGRLILPEGLQVIEYSAFRGAAFADKTLVFPSSLKEIGENAFYLADFGYDPDAEEPRRLVLPEGLQTVGPGAFWDNEGLVLESLPQSLRVIGSRAFWGITVSEDLRLPAGCVAMPDAFSRTDPATGQLVANLSPFGEFSEPDGQGFSYRDLGNGEAELAAYAPQADRSGGKHAVPAVTPTGLRVTRIGAGAFRESGITGTMTFPDGLKSIGDCAFQGCGGLTGKLSLPEGLESVGSFAFEYTGFSGALTLPESLVSLGEYAFSNCGGFTGGLTLPEGLSAVPAGAFQGLSGMKGRLSLPDELTEIGNSAFSDGGFTGTLNLPAGLTRLGAYAFTSCAGLNGTLAVPGGVSVIGEGAFNGCKGITGLSLSEGLTEIGLDAFYYCTGLAGTLTLPSTLRVIREDAFLGCRGLSGRLVLPEGLTEIRRGAFYGCAGLTGVTFPASLSYIGEDAFLKCTALSGAVEIPAGCRVADAFRGTKVILPGQEKDEAGFVFRVLPDGTAALNRYTGKSRKNLVIPGTTPSGRPVTEIDDYVLHYSSLSGSLTLSENIRTIGEAAFSANHDLTGPLRLPDSLTEIGREAFYSCIKLSGDLVIPDGVEVVGDTAFCNCFTLNGRLVLGSGLRRIGSGAFGSCAFTGALTLPDRLEYIGAHAISLGRIEEGNDVTVRIPETVSHYGREAIGSDIYSTGSIRFFVPDGAVPGLAPYAFGSCVKLYGTAGSAIQAYAERYGYALWDEETESMISDGY